MLKHLTPVLLVLAGAADVQPVATGRWDVTSTATALDIPGVPGFMLRMMKGRAKTEYKCVSPDQAVMGVAILLAPDPKAHCQVDGLQIAGGRYAQMLSCPQKQGAPFHVNRTGTYDATGFTGQVHMTGATPEGPMSIVLDQTTTHAAGPCKS